MCWHSFHGEGKVLTIHRCIPERMLSHTYINIYTGGGGGSLTAPHINIWILRHKLRHKLRHNAIWTRESRLCPPPAVAPVLYRQTLAKAPCWAAMKVTVRVPGHVTFLPRLFLGKVIPQFESLISNQVKTSSNKGHVDKSTVNYYSLNENDVRSHTNTNVSFHLTLFD